ncbi:MAG: hypothetical protein CM1200mP41_10950 [Gammaproteobacteria bacterium]|nr:MAG: hypothetical protein CM1200mP41_10950 [Gammaproteobacteria bacterium]
MANGGSAKGAQWDVNQNGLLDEGERMRVSVLPVERPPRASPGTEDYWKPVI